MANVNQGVRSGNALGRLANTDFSGYDADKVALKPGYLIRLRDRFHLVEAVEPMTVDLFFTDSVNVGNTVSSGVASALTGTHGPSLAKYGKNSISAYYDMTATTTAGTRYGNILKPDFDSGFMEFGDLEPFKGNLYQLCPTLPNQPKYMAANGEWHSQTAFGATTLTSSAATSFEPIGFPAAQLLAADNNQALDLLDIGDTTDTVASNENGFSGSVSATQVGTVSGKLYIKHPAGVPKSVLDEAPEGSSGPSAHSANAHGKLEGLSGFIDGQMSPVENPAWQYSLFIEHGENNLPVFKFVNDSDEFLIDGRIRLTGWKYRILELTKEQLQTLKTRSGGRLTFKIINTTGLPVAGAMLADYFPK
jgi:hypothetical protein